MKMNPRIILSLEVVEQKPRKYAGKYWLIDPNNLPVAFVDLKEPRPEGDYLREYFYDLVRQAVKGEAKPEKK